MRLGIMGGTFDPIHYGHLFVAEEAHARFRLDQVLFVPNGQPPHKKDYPLTPAAHRYAMTQIATHGNPAFHCSPLEIQRAGLSYTVDTLAHLLKVNRGAELFYITGVDAVAEILSWKRHEEVIRMAQFIAATRPGYPLSRLKELLPPTYLERILILGTTTVGISSTDMRVRVSKNLPIRYLTPDGVVQYIYKHRLYLDLPSDAAVDAANVPGGAKEKERDARAAETHDGRSDA